jgi:hypothetical protein
MSASNIKPLEEKGRNSETRMSAGTQEKENY